MKLTVKPDAPATFDLCLRIPGWTRGQPVPSDLYRDDQTNPPAVSLAVNGDPVEAAPGKDGYVRITRSWQPGDVVELNLPMPVRRIHAHENLAENRGKVALMRGPVVYCFEGIDNPGADLFQATLPRGAEPTSSHRADLLGGVTTVRANGMERRQARHAHRHSVFRVGQPGQVPDEPVDPRIQGRMNLESAVESQG